MQSCLAIFLAFLLGLMILGVLVFLSLGYAAIVAAVAVVISGVIGFHYVVWGWWLHRLIDDDERDEASSP